MRKLIGVANLAFSLLFFVAGGVAFAGAPTQYADRVREPEDFYGLLFLFGLATAIGLVFLLLGNQLVRERNFSLRSSPFLWGASAFVSLALLALGLLDIVGPTDPGTFGLRIMFVPALMIGLAMYLSASHSRSLVSDKSNLDKRLGS